MAADNFSTTLGGKMDGFEVGDTVSWWNGYDRVFGEVIGLDSWLVVVQEYDYDGYVRQIWPEFLRKEN